jgi:L-iditol 2-dehydrogenase
MKKMRAAILYGKEDVRVEDVPVPKIADDEILIRVGAALTCGTDLKVFRRGYHAKMMQLPSVFGHEFAGTVVESHSPKFDIHDRVVVANSAPCGECYFCNRGQENLCDDLQFLNGAYAEYLRVPARFVEKNTYEIPDHLSFAEAALTEPLACVIHGFEETAPHAGETIAVIGLGPIGLMFLGLLKHRGFHVIGVGRHSARLDLARKLGADEIIEADSKNKWIEHVRKKGVIDVVIEATGRPDVWEHAIDLVRKGGVVNLFGGCPAGSKITLDTTRMHYDQITLKSSFHHKPFAIRSALDALSVGVLKAKDFITDQKLLDELPNVLNEMLQTKSAVKTCIMP